MGWLKLQPATARIRVVVADWEMGWLKLPPSTAARVGANHIAIHRSSLDRHGADRPTLRSSGRLAFQSLQRDNAENKSRERNRPGQFTLQPHSALGPVDSSPGSCLILPPPPFAHTIIF
ncbi:hypothetical protein V22_01990 [Calycomorphotria hydatis]|uniref:Uncharacterized protein n=1 Tax=Calycomorphotria hydatis TaxID=2528027 RepID=A0A517T3S9_9PLAN|nr:hypothetical protein V22_01990 [Calycomorphotria hydatis]